MPGLISVAEFVEESREDVNSPTTSTFVSRMPQCRQTVAALEEVSYRLINYFVSPSSPSRAQTWSNCEIPAELCQGIPSVSRWSSRIDAERVQSVQIAEKRALPDRYGENITHAFLDPSPFRLLELLYSRDNVHSLEEQQSRLNNSHLEQPLALEKGGLLIVVDANQLPLPFHGFPLISLLLQYPSPRHPVESGEIFVIARGWSQKLQV